MITSTMNKLEVNSNMKRYVKAASNRLITQVEKFHEVLRKMPKVSTHKEVVWRNKQSMQDYIACFFSKLGMHGEQILAKVMRGKNLWYYSYCADTMDTMDTMDIFSHHFFARYAERTGTPFLMPTVIGKFFMNNMNFVKVFQNENGDTVYASREGLSLCRWDEERGITKHCTFVSKSLLKHSQLEAFNLVVCKLEEAEKKFAGKRDLHIQIDIIRRWSESCTAAFEMANEVYSTYFEEAGEE